ncbi:hypothetical protein [Mesorhizobium sp. B2-3-5]|uniref:hypothetical protein n=1 Tax=Mesorhizobium sp. B2-3-5 TaxID=2589958 RepID=UPI001126F7E0|nr:hypothetical protein [Mesorhizobium sp. B2-3-5]TPM25294.1 hypothetical protein FJ958_21520 [Mesorhizobium sp. B2-3-5]
MTTVPAGFISIGLHLSHDVRRTVNDVQWQNRDLLQSAHQRRIPQGVGHSRSVAEKIDSNLYEAAEVADIGQQTSVHMTWTAGSRRPT